MDLLGAQEGAPQKAGSSGGSEQIRCSRSRLNIEDLRGGFAIALLANVLHELPPDGFAEVMQLATRSLQGEGARVVVLEIYPLLAPEKFAVPYPPSILRGVLRAACLDSLEQHFSVRECDAYALVATPHGDCETGEVIAAVEKAWEEIERLACSSYAARSAVSDMHEYRSMLQDLMSRASVAAWRAGTWSSKSAS